MSKIFEAIRKAEGEVAQLARETLGTEALIEKATTPSLRPPATRPPAERPHTDRLPVDRQSAERLLPERVIHRPRAERPPVEMPLAETPQVEMRVEPQPMVEPTQSEPVGASPVFQDEAEPVEPAPRILPTAVSYSGQPYPTLSRPSQPTQSYQTRPQSYPIQPNLTQQLPPHAPSNAAGAANSWSETGLGSEGMLGAGTARAPEVAPEGTAWLGNGPIFARRVLPLNPKDRPFALNIDEKNAQASEQYRIIRTKLMQYPVELRVLMVSSPMPGDGKTLTAMNLSLAMSLQEGVETLVVDGDCRRSSLSGALGWKREIGLTDVLRGSVALEDAMIRAEQFPNLYVLPAGTPSENPTELLASATFHQLVNRFRERFRLTLFDCPPVAAVADYELTQAVVDGVILVVRPGHTDRDLCFQAFEAIPKEKQVGVVWNCVQDWFLWKTHGYYYYSSKH